MINKIDGIGSFYLRKTNDGRLIVAGVIPLPEEYNVEETDEKIWSGMFTLRVGEILKMKNKQFEGCGIDKILTTTIDESMITKIYSEPIKPTIDEITDAYF